MDTSKDNTLTALQAALIDAGYHVIPFHTATHDYGMDIKDLPDATILRVLTYGKRMMNDYVNSAKATSDTPVEELAAGWVERAKAGTLGQGGGTRQALDPMGKAIKEIVVDYLRKSGMKANEARKLAKDPAQAFSDMLADKITSAQGMPAMDDQVQAAFDKNWPKVETQAQAIVNATTGLSVDI